MSLILEALRKLDREKQVPERGFLVMAPAAWPSHDRSGRRWAWLVLAAAALAVVTLAWLGRAPRRQAVETPQPLQAPAPKAVAPPAVQQATPVEASAASPSRTPAAIAAPSATPTTLTALPATATPAASAASQAAGPGAAVPAAPAFVLQAITERDGRPLALINDRMLREGDEIDGARIVKIGDTFVEIDYQGRRSALRF